jgi:hypothetical protein
MSLTLDDIDLGGSKFIDHINDIAFKFLWNNKQDKIKRNTIIADYENGGLKMLDIKSFLKAQKAMWAKRLVSPDHASWKAVPMFFFDMLLSYDTFKCSMKCKDKPKNFPDFYWQVLEYWNEATTLTKNTQENPFDIRRECLWLNKDITINRKTVEWNSWHINGINIIHDIVNKEGKFKTPLELEQQYNIKCNVLKYSQLKDAIPITWRKRLKTIKIPQEAISFNQIITLKIKKKYIPITKVTNKDIYWIFINKIKINPVTKEKLEEITGTVGEEWKEIFKIPLAIRDTKKKTFQYKILFNLIPCNLYLHRIKRSDTNLCITCNKLDDLEHYIYECNQVKPIWISFKNWWNNITHENIELRYDKVLAGFLEAPLKNQALNACIIMVKWYIYKSKLNESQLFFYQFLCDLRYFINIEKIIAIRSNKLQKYTTTWQTIEDNLT